jgi:AcrR family transcriptional regulator
MTRPSRNQDRLLLETAKRLLPELGVEKMSLKRIADESGVNLGMIHYYFQTKSALISCVLESIHEELVGEFESKTLAGNTPFERLRSGLIAIAKVVYIRRKLIISLLRDFLGRDRESTKFFFELAGKRMKLIIPLIQQCQKEGYIENMPLYQVLGFCMASINIPTLMSEGIERIPIKRMKLPDFTINQLAGEKAIIQRVDLALKAITKNKGRVL